MSRMPFVMDDKQAEDKVLDGIIEGKIDKYRHYLSKFRTVSYIYMDIYIYRSSYKEL